MSAFSKPDLPTPLTRCAQVSTARATVWIKNDGLSHPVYGGNKVRKLDRLISDAVRRGARSIVTMGAAGSHHVLTTALFARQAGLRCKAVLIPQPATPHVRDTLRAALGQGLEAYPAASIVGLPAAIFRAASRRDYVIPPGGSNLVGARPYADAVDELCAEIESGRVPEPDLVVVAFGSGGTAAGLVAGIARRKLRTRVVAIQVLRNPLARSFAIRLAKAVLKSGTSAREGEEIGRRLIVDARYVGRGYGFATTEGEAASEVAREFGLELDSTYTAKAFAALLDLAHGRGAKRLGLKSPLNVLYWHTLSARPLEPLLANAPKLTGPIRAWFERECATRTLD